MFRIYNNSQVIFWRDLINCGIINPLMPDGKKKVTHKYVRPFCYHQALKG